jgi:hypothetical protein
MPTKNGHAFEEELAADCRELKAADRREAT